MSKKIFSIWLLPIDSDNHYLSKIVQSLSEVYNATFFQPHCTLFSSINNLKNAEKIIDHIDIDSFKVDVNGINHSNHVWKTVFIDLKNTIQLQSLNLLWKNFEDEEYLFSPHISLIYKSLEMDKRKKIIQNLSIKKSFSFDKIAIVNTTAPVEYWETVYSKLF